MKLYERWRRKIQERTKKKAKRKKNKEEEEELKKEPGRKKCRKWSISE